MTGIPYGSHGFMFALCDQPADCYLGACPCYVHARAGNGAVSAYGWRWLPLPGLAPPFPWLDSRNTSAVTR